MPASWHSVVWGLSLDASLLAFSCECACVCVFVCVHSGCQLAGIQLRVCVCHVSGCQLAGIQLRVCVLFLDASLLAFSHVPSYLFGFLMFATRLTDSSDLKIDFFAC